VLARTVARAETWTGRGVGILLGLGVLFLAGWLMTLMIQWREVMIAKQDASARPPARAERRWRNAALAAFRVFLFLSPALWLCGLWAVTTRARLVSAVGSFLARAPDWLGLGGVAVAPRLYLALALALGLALALWRLAVWLWVILRRGKWRDLLRLEPGGERMKLAFQSYLDTDPTRSDPLDEGVA
jgi:hypothetical protein